MILHLDIASWSTVQLVLDGDLMSQKGEVDILLGKKNREYGVIKHNMLMVLAN